MRGFGILVAAFALLAGLVAPAPLAGAAPVTVAVVDSEATYVNFAQLGWWTERPPRVASTLAAAGYTVVTFDDADLEDPAALASVDVVVLPLTRVMNERASVALRDWVAAGGGLVAAFISPRMLPRPGCRWTGANHPRSTSNLAASWTCWSNPDGGFEFWARELNSAAWEYGPLSEAFQTLFINDPTPTQFSVTDDPAGAAHPIVAGTTAALGISGIRLDRPTGAGAEFTRLFNTNATSLLRFSIPPGTGSAEGVDASQYDGYTAAQATRYESGRIVYFDFDILDFLPQINAANAAQTYQGVSQGDIALELLTQSIDWAAAASGSATINRDARTWAEVDVYNTGIYLRQKVVAEGNVSTLGDLVARIYDPAGRLVYESRRNDIGLYPGGPPLSYSLPGYIPGGVLSTAGPYRVEVSYLYSYPDYRRVHVEAVEVVRNQGKNISTSLVYDGALPERLAGADRYATAAAISAATFSPGVPVAYVATAASFPDALAGAAAAAGRGPILLVTSSGIPAATAAELARLSPGKIVVLGGVGAVSEAVASQLSSYTSGPVVRLAGADRYATAAAISAATFSPGVPVAYVATGQNFPDALAGGCAAAAGGGPILLVSPTSVPAATRAELTRLGPGRVVVLGGAAAVSDAVLVELASFGGG